MKRCQSCGAENAVEMNFCGECGAKFADEPQMVVPLETIESLDLPVTESFGEKESFETKVGNRFQVDPSVPTLSSVQEPQGGGSKMIFWVFGGCLTLLLIAFIGLAGFMYVNWQSNREVASNSKTEPTPARTIEEKAPTPKSTEMPEQTPKEEPEETPKETPASEEEPELEDPDGTPEVTFTPPEKPTRQGSYTVRSNEGWQISEIDTVPSEIFRTNVRGKVFLDGIDKSVSPEGIEGEKSRRIYKQFRTGALLMRTRFANGKVGNIMPATDSNEWENYPNETGRLEFLVNDNSSENNKGIFIITVRMVSVPE